MGLRPTHGDEGLPLSFRSAARNLLLLYGKSIFLVAPLLCRNSTRNLCGINNIAQTALVEFLPIMGSRKAVDARNDRRGRLSRERSEACAVSC
jgi:hypothetical protein